MTRLLLAAILALVLSGSAFAAIPWGIGVSEACVEGVMHLVARVYNYQVEGDENPFAPDGYTIWRRDTAPGLLGPDLLTEVPIMLPAPGTWEEFELADPAVPAEGIGYYEVLEYREGEPDQLDSAAALSCVEHPYLMRARLLTDELAEPCVGIDLLECTAVSIADLEFLQYVGTGELLDIHGWPIYVDGVDQCAVSITHIEPLGMDATCEGVVATEIRSWSAVKSLYR